MENRTVFKSFAKYVSLNVWGMIGLSCYILADTFFVANALGSNGLAALNFSISIYCILNGAGLMIGIGGATRYAILQSQHDMQRANTVFTHTLALGLLAGLAFALAGVFLATPLARVLGADKSTLPMTVDYLTTILLFSPCFILNSVLLAFVRNDGNPKLAMSAMLLGSLSNVLLDYIFMFPLQWGMFGAAFATGLAPVISLAVLSLHFLRHKNKCRPVRCRPEAGIAGDVFRLGLSAFVTEATAGLVLIVFNILILRLEGNVGVAAYGVVANIALVVTSMFTGIAQGMQPLVSRGYGKNDRPMLTRVLRYAIVSALLVAAAAYTVAWLFPDAVVSIFNREQNPDMARLAARGLRLYFLGFFLAGFNIITAAFFSAAERAAQAFSLSILRGCVAILPIVLLLAWLLKMDGVWLSFVCAELATAGVSAVLLRRWAKKPALL